VQRKYGTTLRASYVEAVAGFKAMVKLLQVEARKRGSHAPLPVPALGEKESTIRNIFQPFLDRKQFYIRAELRGKVMEELRIFPSPHMDLLDALKIAVYKSYKPKTIDHTNDDYDDDDDALGQPSKAWLARHRRNARSFDTSAVTGY
jgi:hypothetical protein